MTIVNNSILYNWNLLRVELKCSHRKERKGEKSWSLVFKKKKEQNCNERTESTHLLIDALCQKWKKNKFVFLF